VCGIAGQCWDDGRPPDPAELDAMAAALRHRGPDHTGTAVVGPVGLAATRLAILDLGPSGDQPLVADGFGLAFNGELYNHRALRAELRGAGVSLAGTSDTEVLFHLLRLQGVDAVMPRLRGMFAFAWTGPDGVVHLVRDRFGIKPLHWTRHGGRTLWGSEVKAIAPVVPLEVDGHRAVLGVLSLADRWSSRTVFSGVEQVPPGGLVRVRPGGSVEERRWHRLADEVDPALARDLAAAERPEIVGRLGALLDAAISACCTSDAPLGSLVSGGVDSSLVAAGGAEQQSPHRLFTASIDGGLDEAPHARLLAAHLHEDLVETRFTPDMALADWARATWHYEAPIVTHVNALPLARVAAAVRDTGTKAVLTGEGADELFAGYPSTAARSQLHVLGAPFRLLQRGYGLVPGLAERIIPSGTTQEAYLAKLGDGFEAARQRAEAAEAFGHLPPDEAKGAVETYVALQGHLRTLLHRNDRMGMQGSIECRFPYLDEDLVRFGLNLPQQHKLHTSWRLHDPKHPFVVDKAPLRALAARRGLPGARRPKAGFPTWGHLHMQVDAGLFRDGYVATVLGLDEQAVDHLVTSEPPYYVAKLASVEVFGRLHATGEGVDATTDLVLRHVRMAATASRSRSRLAVPWTR